MGYVAEPHNAQQHEAPNTDTNNDGIFDHALIDNDYDGFADTEALDTNADGVYDTFNEVHSSNEAPDMPDVDFSNDGMV